ncbi:MAG TPA: hypothetical protein VK590_02895 [Saprospiraceae bacterium]|nr:hypothetical protein [Saprospiraceae bacterium]
MTPKDPEEGEYRTTKFLLKRDLYVALCGAGLFFAYLWNKQPGQIYQLSLLNFFGLYLFYRWLHIRHLSFSGHRIKYLLELIIPFIAAVILLVRLKGLPVIFYVSLAFTGVVAVFYNLKIGSFRLRTVPFFKSLLISLVWVILLVLLPEYLSNNSNSQIIESCIENFLFVLALTVMYDIYDIYEDELHGTKTLVNFKFNKYAEGIVVSLLLLSSIPSLVCIEEINYSYSPVLIQLIISLIGIAMISIFKRRKTIWLLLLWDGLILLKAVLIIIFVRINF